VSRIRSRNVTAHSQHGATVEGEQRQHSVHFQEGLAAAVNDPRPGCSFWPDENNADDDLAMDVDVPAGDAGENFQVR